MQKELNPNTPLNIDLLEIDEHECLIKCKDRYITEIEIPDCVKSIGSGAFSCFTSLSSVFIPDSVTLISP